MVPKLGSSVLSADVSYLLIGGTGGLGRSIARWMSSKGARNIVLVSRSASINTKVQALIDELAAHGTTISVKPCDVSDMKSVNNLINQELKGLPPVRGVVHGAMVLRDMLFEKTTLADFQAVASCKVEGAWNLHHALHDSPLDFFVALSSVAGIIGNRGQAAYAAANAFLDGFMEYRRSRGLPGTTIDLTAVRDVGYLAEVETKRREEVLKNIGTDGIDEAQVLALLGAAVTGTLLQSCSGQSITGLDLGTRLDHFWVQDSKFCSLYEAAKEKYGNSTEDDMLSLPLKVQLANAPSKVEAQAIVYEALAAKLAQVLVMPPEELNPETSIAVLGVDSLVAIEIRNWISREAHSNVQVLELLSSGSLMALAGIILNNSTISFSPS